MAYKVSESRAKSRGASDCVRVCNRVLYAEGYKYSKDEDKEDEDKE